MRILADDAGFADAAPCAGSPKRSPWQHSRSNLRINIYSHELYIIVINAAVPTVLACSRNVQMARISLARAEAAPLLLPQTDTKVPVVSSTDTRNICWVQVPSLARKAGQGHL